MFLIIFMLPEFSLMTHFKRINFYQHKPTIKLLLQQNKTFVVLVAPSPEPQWPLAELPDPHNSLSPYCRPLVTYLTLNMCCSYFQVLAFYSEKLLS